MQYGFHFNGLRCTGCKTCMFACKDFHDLPSSIAFRQIYEYGGGIWQREADGTLSQNTFCYYVSSACNHCGNPACVRVCPTGAMHKDERGLVSVDGARCIGCGYCALGDAADLPPLPDAVATSPNLVLTPPACFEADAERVRAEGQVLNIREIV